MTEAELNDDGITPVAEPESVVTETDTFRSGPAWWSLLLLYSFPMLWMFGTPMLLFTITEICFYFNFNLVLQIGEQVLLAPFLIVPAVVACWLLVKKEWFALHLILALLIWAIIASTFCITQAAINTTLNRAMAVPGHGELDHYTERVPYNQRNQVEPGRSAP